MTEMYETKTCSMVEVKPDRPHTQQDRKMHCVCSECGTKITAGAEFSREGRLHKVWFPIRNCPNCDAEIVKFIQYHEG